MINWREAEMVAMDSSPCALTPYLEEPETSSPEGSPPKKRKSMFPSPKEFHFMIRKLQRLEHLNILLHWPSSYIHGTTRVAPGFWDPLMEIIPEYQGKVKRYFLQFPLEAVEKLDPASDSLLKVRIKAVKFAYLL